MKEKVFILFLVNLFIASVLTSCEKEKLYSCNPIVNKWVIKNFEKIEKMDSEDFFKLKSVSYKKAAYGIMSTKNRVDIWNTKLQELKKLNWTKQEWDHIEKIYNLVLDDSRNIFQMRHIQDNDSLLIEIYRWEKYAKEELKWTKKMIYGICYTPEKVINKRGDLYKNSKQIKVLRDFSDGNEEDIDSDEFEGGFECSCSQISSYCDIIDHEGPDYTVCKQPRHGKCKEIKEGCGLFWRFTCDGMCLGLYV